MLCAEAKSKNWLRLEVGGSPGLAGLLGLEPEPVNCRVLIPVRIIIKSDRFGFYDSGIYYYFPVLLGTEPIPY